MPNPYGITEVDIPGILGAYQSARNGRMQSLLLERKIAAEDRTLERETNLMQAYAKFAKPDETKGGDPASASAAPSTGAAPVASPMMDPARRSAFIGELAALDPKQAMEMQKQFSEMDKDQREQTKESYKALASVAAQLKSLPQAERSAALAQIAPALQAMGVTPDMLGRADLSDRGLDLVIAIPRDVEKIIESGEPDWQQVDGALVDTKTMREGYVSPMPKIISGPNGELIPLYRPGVSPPEGAPPPRVSGEAARPTSAAEYEALPPGTTYYDQQGNLKRKGGAGQSGPRTFPQ